MPFLAYIYFFFFYQSNEFDVLQYILPLSYRSLFHLQHNSKRIDTFKENFKFKFLVLCPHQHLSTKFHGSWFALFVTS